MRSADDGGFGDARMVDKRAFDFHRADSMTGDVQHIVNTAKQPEEPVLIPLCAIAGEVNVWRPPTPVLLHVPLGVAVDPAQHGGPWACQSKKASACSVNALAAIGLDLRLDAGKWARR